MLEPTTVENVPNKVRVIDNRAELGKALAGLIKIHEPKDNREGITHLFDYRNEAQSYRDAYPVLAMSIISPPGEQKNKSWVRMVLSQLDLKLMTDSFKIEIGKAKISEGEVDWPFFKPAGGPYVDKPIEDNQKIMELVRTALIGLEDNNVLVSASKPRI